MPHLTYDIMISHLVAGEIGTTHLTMKFHVKFKLSFSPRLMVFFLSHCLSAERDDYSMFCTGIFASLIDVYGEYLG